MKLVLWLLIPASIFNLAAGTITLGAGTVAVSGGDSDSSTPPAFVTNPNAFAFKVTDGIATLSGQQRRNTDPKGGANLELDAVGAFDGRQVTISGTITALTVADSEGDVGGHSQAFALGLATKGWRDQAAATYNLNLISFQPDPAKEGFVGIALGYRQGTLYLVAYDYDNQPDQIFLDLGKAGLASGQSITSPLTFTMAFNAGSLSVKVNDRTLGSIRTSHDLSNVLLVALGASVDPNNGPGSMTFSTVTATTPATSGPPAVLFPVSGDNQSAVAGTAAAAQIVVGVADALRNPLLGVTVNLTGVNATTDPASPITDAAGQARAKVVLGTKLGPATVAAAVAGLPDVTFHLTAFDASSPPNITGVVNGASFLPGIVSGSWATILGTNLAFTARTAGTNDFSNGALPVKLDDTSVTINGKPAFVYFISPMQLNVLVPDDGTIGGVAIQATTRSSGVSNVFTAGKAAYAPALFGFTPLYPAAVHADGTYIGPPNLISGATTRPAKPNEIILLFGTGFGETNPLVAAGTLFPNAAPVAQPITATVGGLPADVKGFLIYPGVYQLNLTVPNLPDGDAAISISVAGSRMVDGPVLTIAH